MSTEPTTPNPFEALTPAQVDDLLADVRFARESGAGYGFVTDRYPHLLEQAQAWHAAQAAPAVPAVVQPVSIPGVQTVCLPDGRVVTGYAIDPRQPAPVEQPRDRPAVHPLLVNAALGAAAFAGIGIGLHFLAEFITALAHLMWALVAIVAIVCGAPVALQLLRAMTGSGSGQQQTVINAKRVKVGRIINRGGAQ